MLSIDIRELILIFVRNYRKMFLEEKVVKMYVKCFINLYRYFIYLDGIYIIYLLVIVRFFRCLVY